MSAHPILHIKPLGFTWETSDPFLFCAYHNDAYPPGNAQLGPQASLAGRTLGQDFSRKDGWSMYHGEQVPGFPAHPHRGFETVTIVRKGRIDHSDSLGARARFGGGDVQWLTAGRGVVHAEMFPLLQPDAANPLELFQIWLNLPAADKMAAPYFTMFWADQIPHHISSDAQGRNTEIAVIAGRLYDVASPGTTALVPLAPPPDSWAAQAEADVAIWTIRMAPGAAWTLPAADGQGTRRTLYFFKGLSVGIAGQDLQQHGVITLRSDLPVSLHNSSQDEAAEFLLLQGRPLNEPVAQYGPFVMNTKAEISQAIDDYQRTRFGGWPWPDEAPVHGSDPARFAQHPDGRDERP